jgi:ABC-type lipoprotein release transport system permease subunit
MLHDVKPTDPAVFAANAVLVLIVSLAACYLPARWAGRVDPALVLRND